MFNRLAFTLLIALLVTAGVAIIVGQLLIIDAIRPSFLPYARYLPGEPRPAFGCEDVWDWTTEYYGISFACVYTGRDIVHAYGGGGVISGVFITFADVRAGDVLALLGDPLPPAPYQSRRSRSRFYEVAGIRTYFTRPISLFARQKYLSFWKPLPA